MSRAALPFLPAGGRGLSPNQAYQAALDLGWVDARKFGKPGALNSTTAQRAIDETITVDGSVGINKPVFFVGDWDFGSGGPVTIPRTGTRTHARLYGLGPGQTIIRTDGATGFDTDTSGITGLEIRGMRFIDEDAAVTAGAWAIDLVRVADVWIDEIYATGYHNALRLAYAQTYRIRNIVLRDPKNAVTAGDSAMLLLDNHDIGGPSFRRCINGYVENARIISGVSGDARTKANYPDVCVEVRGADGCVFRGGNWSGADAFMRIKMYDGQNVSGLLTIDGVYMDGVDYTTDGILIEPPDTTGSIGALTITGDTFIGNLSSSAGSGPGGETTAIKATEAVGILRIGPEVRIGGCDVGVDLSQGTTETFETYAYIKADVDNIRIDAGENNKIGGTIDGGSGNGVELTGTMGSVLWDNPIFKNCTALVSNSATITDERGNASSPDSALTYFDALQPSGGGSAVYSTYTPAFSFSVAGDLSVSYSNQTGRHIEYGELVHAMGRVAGTPTFTTSSGGARLSLPSQPVSLANPGLVTKLSAGPSFPSGCTQIYIAASTSAAVATIAGFGTATAQTSVQPAQFTSGVAVEFYFSILYRAT